MYTAKQLKFASIGLSVVMILALKFMTIFQIEGLDTTIAYSISDIGDSGGFTFISDLKDSGIFPSESENFEDASSLMQLMLITFSYSTGFFFGVVMLLLALFGKVRPLKVMTVLSLVAPVMFFSGKSGLQDFHHPLVKITIPSTPMILYLLCTLAIGYIWFKAIKKTTPE